MCYDSLVMKLTGLGEEKDRVKQAANKGKARVSKWVTGQRPTSDPSQCGTHTWRGWSFDRRTSLHQLKATLGPKPSMKCWPDGLVGAHSHRAQTTSPCGAQQALGEWAGSQESDHWISHNAVLSSRLILGP